MKKKLVDYLLSLVKHNYNEIAVSFDATRKKELWPQIRELAAAIKDGESILDAGCGNGRLLEALKDKKVGYLGIDNSPELIKAAKINYPLREFRVADILDLEKIPEHDFDHIFCLAVLQHIPSRELRIKFLKNLGAKLKASGVLVVSSWNLGRIPKYRRMIFRNRWLKLLGRYPLGVRDLVFPWKDSGGRAVSDRYYHAFREGELKRLSVVAGFKILTAKPDKYNFWLRLGR